MNVIKNEVLIFKASPEDSENEEDSFKKTLQEAGYSTQNIPVLEFEYCNLDLLQKHLENPDQFSGLIFTSPRGVKAVTHIKDVDEVTKEWQKHPVFVVGEGTSKILKNELNLSGQGSNAGNASALADLILESKYDKPILFPCGNLKRDTLPSKLSDGGVSLTTVTVYQTKIHQHLEQALSRFVSQSNSFPEVVVYFSPSGVKFTVPILLKLGVPLQELKLVAIGPTTEESLCSYDLKVSSVASKPTPEHLLDAIKNAAI